MYTYRLTSERTYNYSEWGLILGDRTSRVTNTARKRNCYITCIGTFFGSLFHIWNFWWELLYGKCQISSFRLTEQQVWFDVCDFKFLVEKSSLEFVSLFAKFVYNLYGFCVKWEWPRERHGHLRVLNTIVHTQFTDEKGKSREGESEKRQQKQAEKLGELEIATISNTYAHVTPA